MTVAEFLKMKKKQCGITFAKLNAALGYNAKCIVPTILSGTRNVPHGKEFAFCNALGIQPLSEDWYKFFDLMSSEYGEIPRDIIEILKTDDSIVKHIREVIARRYLECDYYNQNDNCCLHKSGNMYCCGTDDCTRDKKMKVGVIE